MRLEFLQNIAPELEAIALQYFRQEDLGVENKGAAHFDPVTLADKNIEAHFRSRLAEAFPEDEVLGEEFESNVSKDGALWTIDPIDGTRAFVIGAPSFAILIDFKSSDEAGFALVSQPFTGERFWARQGGAFWQRGAEEKRIKVSGQKSLAKAKLASTFPEIGTKEEREAFERVASLARLVRYGMDAYAYALLAMGQVDLVIEAGLEPYDYAAPKALVEAAGGVVYNWLGLEPKGRDNLVVAASEALAREALEMLGA